MLSTLFDVGAAIIITHYSLPVVESLEVRKRQCYAVQKDKR